MVALLTACDRGGFSVTDGPTRQALSGILVVGSVNGVDCAWIEESSGRRVEVFWPDRWRTEFHPLAIYDENGVKAVSGGGAVILSGFFGEVGASLCTTGALFNAEKVISAGARDY